MIFIAQIFTRLFSLSVITVAMSGCQLVVDVTDTVSAPRGDTINQGQPIPPWNSLSLGALPQVTHHQGAVLTALENPASRTQLISVGADGSIIGWDLAAYSGHRILSLPTPISLAALGEQAPLVATYSVDGISVLCVNGCSRSWKLSRLKIKPTALAFHEKDSALLVAGADGRVYRWRFLNEGTTATVEEQEKLLERYIAHQNIVSTVASHPFGRAFFTGDWNGALFGWLPYTADAHAGAYDRNLFGGRFYSDKISFVQALRKPDRGISSLTVSASGERLGVGTEDGNVEVWEIKGFVQSARQTLHAGRVLSVAFDAKGERIASVGRDQFVSVAALERDPSFGIAPNATSWRLLPATHQRIENANHVLFLRNGNLIVTTSEGALAEVSDLKAPPPTSIPTPRSTNTLQDSDY